MTRADTFKMSRFLLAGFFLAGLFSVTGCTLDAPTYMSQKKVEVTTRQERIEQETATLDDPALRQIAAYYADHGDGPVDIVVTYNPQSRDNTARHATDSAAHMASVLHKEGVRDVKTDILPIHASDKSVTYVKYMSYEAQAPEGCVGMEDINDIAHENYRDYQLGCSTETYLAKQIAKPKDLLGRTEVTEETDARKRANAVEAYKWTTGSQPLEAESTSGN